MIFSPERRPARGLFGKVVAGRSRYFESPGAAVGRAAEHRRKKHIA
jgi:hypothetical protein